MTPALLCMTVRHCPPRNVAKGSVIEKCSICSDLIWVSLSSQAMRLKSPEVQLICVCGLARMEPENTVVSLVPGSIKEVERHFENMKPKEQA